MLLWIIATLVAFFVKGLCGFANTLVFTSIMGFGANNVAISPIELMLGYPANFILTLKNRKKLNPKVFIPLAIMVLAGSVPGAFLLKNVNATYIKIVFGVVIVFLGIEMLLREYGSIKFKESKIALVIIGLLSGVLCGLFGVGALLAAYVGRVTETTDGFKANMSAVFIVENTFRLILYSVMGIITLEGLKQALILMPVVIGGLLLGMWSGKVLNERIVKRLVIALLIVSGIALIVMNL